MGNNSDNTTERHKIEIIKNDLLKYLKGFRLSHYILRPYVYGLLRVYHSNIVIDGFEDIDWDKPVILAPSHQNAFMDALLVVSRTPYEPESYLYPLIRADVYENNILRNIVSEFHMIPVFRPRDRENIANSNRAVFELCEDLLANNRNLLIHPEGNCIPHKKVRTFRKGFARIAFGAEDRHNFSLDVQIIPVSINYQYITRPNGYIHLLFEKPVSVRSYEQLYNASPAQAITKLTRDVEKVVRRNNVDIEHSSNYKLANDLFDLFEPTQKNAPLADKFDEHKKIANKLNSMEKSAKESLKSEVTQYKNKVEELSLTESMLPANSVKWYHLTGYVLLFLVTLPVFLFGWIHHVLPYFAFNWIVRHKVRDIQFKSSARYMLWFIFLPFFYVLIALATGIISSNIWIGLFYAILTGISGLAAYKLHQFYKTWWHDLKYAVQSIINKKKIAGLKKHSSSIKSRILTSDAA
mgnify:CR=1 FL=1